MDPSNAAACSLPRGDLRTAVTLEATRGGVVGLEEADLGASLSRVGDENLSAPPFALARDA